ncbi:hypothetical protein VaNZ11_004557 [Volvox africanus]|uniref:Uncharacterized protein n=1 Tax=Volvox africanus TaxID=51714 RepID=A0ABQ5RXJ2_9CHLO|nr:hypothetical protein VaNZ11_004557 [Volvox africanus]
MLTPETVRQPQRQGETTGPTTHRAENATRVPLSKKCKLDIKRKHLVAAIPGCFDVDSYAINLQLQIDGETFPEIYKCTIKKHVNNKTRCVSYRLQGTGIYNHLRGLYMRGFSCGEEPGVMVLVASREAATDLYYGGQSDGEDVVYTAAADNMDSEAERPKLRRRRQHQSRRQQKRRREYSDDSDDWENGRFRDDREDVRSGEVNVEVEAETAFAGSSGCHLASDPELERDAAELAVHQFQQAHQQSQQLHQHIQHPYNALYPLRQPQMLQPIAPLHYRQTTRQVPKSERHHCSRFQWLVDAVYILC